MCTHRYKGYTICAHEDPQSTPTEPKPCDEFRATGACAQGKRYVLVSEESAQSPCPGCWQLESQLLEAVGSLEDEHRGGSASGSATWRLWHRIGWAHRDVMLVLDVIYVQKMLRDEMLRWEGPRHDRQALVASRIAVFGEFKDWLAGRLEKRDARGRLYFPPRRGEGRPDREEEGLAAPCKMDVYLIDNLFEGTMTLLGGVQELTWIGPVVNMAQGKFDNLDIAIFREGLDMAFNNLIYQWDTHFLEDPGCDCAKEEFTKYWTDWFRKRNKAPTQGEEGGSPTG
ncbi:hypothetical protein CIB48_g1902 [Xylaria polymorpha]|nr:hypothetical protein CIB48_g1902 [Xylaria polymorpha]